MPVIAAKQGIYFKRPGTRSPLSAWRAGFDSRHPPGDGGGGAEKWFHLLHGFLSFYQKIGEMTNPFLRTPSNLEHPPPDRGGGCSMIFVPLPR